MNWQYLASIFCLFCASMMTLDIIKNNAIELLPEHRIGRMAYECCIWVSNIGFILVFIFGFFLLPWWQVLLYTLAALVITVVVYGNRLNKDTYFWIVALSIGGSVAAIDLYETYTLPSQTLSRCIQKAAEMPTSSGVTMRRNECQKEYRYNMNNQ